MPLFCKSRGTYHLSLHPRRNRVSSLIKYFVFGFNGLFWFIGTVLSAIGVWALSEKEVFRNLSKLSRVPDPALFFLIIGLTLFFISGTGWVGALRENICLLSCFTSVMFVLFAVQLIIGILIYVYEDWFTQQVQEQLKNMLVLYREDEDLQNIIDWVQGSWLKCCGVEDFEDWNINEYFNCTSPSVEKCGVPFSCCKFNDDVFIKNAQCGFGVRSDEAKYDILSDRIYIDGCLGQVKKWIMQNSIPVVVAVSVILLVESAGFIFAIKLRRDIKAQIAQWR